MPNLDELARYLSLELKEGPGPAIPGDAVCVRPVITISREHGARGGTIARALAQTLHERSADGTRPWVVYDQDLAAAVIQHSGLSARVAQYMQERGTGQFAGEIEALLGLHPGQRTLAVKTAATIERLAEIGNVVIVGRGANFVTARHPCTLAIRLVGSEAVRTRRIMNTKDLDESAARARMRQVDRDRSSYVKKYFGHDIEDPLAYHLTINTDRLSDAAVVLLVIGLLEPQAT